MDLYISKDQPDQTYLTGNRTNGPIYFKEPTRRNVLNRVHAFVKRAGPLPDFPMARSEPEYKTRKLTGPRYALPWPNLAHEGQVGIQKHRQYTWPPL